MSHTYLFSITQQYSVPVCSFGSLFIVIPNTPSLLTGKLSPFLREERRFSFSSRLWCCQSSRGNMVPLQLSQPGSWCQKAALWPAQNCMKQPGTPGWGAWIVPSSPKATSGALPEKGGTFHLPCHCHAPSLSLATHWDHIQDQPGICRGWGRC